MHYPFIHLITGFDLLIFCLGFYIYVPGRLVYNFPFIKWPCQVWVASICWPHKINWKFYIFTPFLEDVVQGYYYFLYKVWKILSIKPSGSGILFIGRLLSVQFLPKIRSVQFFFFFYWFLLVMLSKEFTNFIYFVKCIDV